jgi:hypothetical protein
LWAWVAVAAVDVATWSSRKRGRKSKSSHNVSFQLPLNLS